MDQVQRDIQNGKSVHMAANTTRAELRWRRRKDDADRQRTIEHSIRDIDGAMKPLRSHIGRLVHDPIPMDQEKSLRAVSQSLQYERRQLKKMRA